MFLVGMCWWKLFENTVKIDLLILQFHLPPPSQEQITPVTCIQNKLLSKIILSNSMKKIAYYIATMLNSRNASIYQNWLRKRGHDSTEAWKYKYPCLQHMWKILKWNEMRVIFYSLHGDVNCKSMINVKTGIPMI